MPWKGHGGGAQVQALLHFSSQHSDAASGGSSCPSSHVLETQQSADIQVSGSAIFHCVVVVSSSSEGDWCQISVPIWVMKTSPRCQCWKAMGEVWR